MRVVVTLGSGAEEARVVTIPKAEAKRVEKLTAKLMKTIDKLLSDQPEDVRVAVIGQIAQRIMRGRHE